MEGLAERYLLPNRFVTRAFLRDVAKEIKPKFDNIMAPFIFEAITRYLLEKLKNGVVDLCAQLYPEINWCELVKVDVEYAVKSKSYFQDATIAVKKDVVRIKFQNGDKRPVNVYFL